MKKDSYIELVMSAISTKNILLFLSIYLIILGTQPFFDMEWIITAAGIFCIDGYTLDAQTNVCMTLLLCGVICYVGSAIVKKLDMLVKINEKD